MGKGDSNFNFNLNFNIFSIIPGSPVPRIWAARIPAFLAPSSPTVATGMPGGICTVARRESSPCNAEESMGTPRTGRVVWAAITPARWAACWRP